MLLGLACGGVAVLRQRGHDAGAGARMWSPDGGFLHRLGLVAQLGAR
jgi:hypothetical protein